eukprot:scaffold610828_cov51-Attheya_sp.AAC.1
MTYIVGKGTMGHPGGSTLRQVSAIFHRPMGSVAVSAHFRRCQRSTLGCQCSTIGTPTGAH